MRNRDLQASYKYFGGRRVGEVNDRLASEMSGGKKYYPYGEERSATANDAYKFATYWREGYSGLDYADQRWYSSVAGRFLTPDPYQASGGVGNPGSWNRYGYVEGDPVNLRDPWGLVGCYECGDYDDLNGDPTRRDEGMDSVGGGDNGARGRGLSGGAGTGRGPKDSFYRRLHSAGALAKSALLKKKCVDEIFGGVDANAAASPYKVLNTYVWDTGKYGELYEADGKDPLISARTYMYYPTNRDSSTVNIEINSNGAFMMGYKDVFGLAYGQGFDGAQTIYRAITLLHELGHVMSALGLPSAIPFESDESGQSTDYSKKIFEACFK